MSRVRVHHLSARKVAELVEVDLSMDDRTAVALVIVPLDAFEIVDVDEGRCIHILPKEALCKPGS